MKSYLKRLPVPARIAHRGGGLEAPENTLEAFRHGLAAGCEGLELDVHFTSDGEPVVLHDPDVARTTDGVGPVSGYPLDALKKLDAGHRFTADGRTFPFRGRGVRIPTLRELFEAFPGVPMSIEIKAATPPQLARFASLVRELGREELLCLGSADHALAEAVLQALPGVCTFFSERAAAEAVFTLKGLEVEGGGRWPFDLLALPLEMDGTPVVDRALVEAAHRRGLFVHVWTLNEARTIQAALDAGVDGIMSDVPTLLARLVPR